MINPKDTINQLLHHKSQEEVPVKDTEETAENPYTVESDNLAMPEVHTKDHEDNLKKREKEQNESGKKEDVVFDTLAIPEIHIKS